MGALTEQAPPVDDYGKKLLACALWYAGHGHAVFPLNPGTKTPATRTGFKAATIDPDKIRWWWGHQQHCNIGLPTGRKFDVLDVDLTSDQWGIVDHPDLAGTGDPIAFVKTPRGGCHLYLPVSGHGNGVGILPGIDWRGQGGYVVGPPSRVPLGEWEFVDLEGLK